MPTTTQVITGIPDVSPLFVFNGRTGHVAETRTDGVVRFRLAIPVSAEDIRLAKVENITDLTGDPQHYEIDVLIRHLTDAPEVLPGREVPAALVDAAEREIGVAYRRAYWNGGGFPQEFWGVIRETITRADLGNLIPESLATKEDARAWVYDYAARERFGL